MPDRPELRGMTLRRTFSQNSESAEERMKAAVVHTAFTRGLWGGLYGGIAGGVALFFANKHDVFGMRTRSRMSVSIKTGLLVTAVVTPFWLRAELTLGEGQQHSERFAPIVEASIAKRAAVPRRTTLPFWQKALNFVHDNPVYSWGALVVPTYAAIFAYESSSPTTAAMVLSQRVMHTRVYGQFAAISTMLVIGLTTDQMKRAGGRFELDDEDAQEGGQQPDSRIASGVGAASAEREGPAIKWSLLVPLMYAPLLPLLRLGLRGRITPRQLDLVTGGAIALALTHAGVTMLGDSTVLG